MQEAAFLADAKWPRPSGGQLGQDERKRGVPFISVMHRIRFTAERPLPSLAMLGDLNVRPNLTRLSRFRRSAVIEQDVA